MPGEKSEFVQIIVDTDTFTDPRFGTALSELRARERQVTFGVANVVVGGAQRLAGKLNVAGDATVAELMQAARKAGFAVLENAEVVRRKQ